MKIFGNGFYIPEGNQNNGFFKARKLLKGTKMDSLREFLRGVYSLGMGCPRYRHSSEDSVPWPHLDNPLRNPTREIFEAWERVIGTEELKKEVQRLGLLDVDDDEIRGPILSNFLYKPSRTTYSTHIPMKKFDLQIDSKSERGVTLVWKTRSPDVSNSLPVPPLPGYARIREIRLRTDSPEDIEEIELKLGSRTMKTVQRFRNPIHLIRFLNKTMGLETITGKYSGSKSGVMITIPFFFSRDPLYALPMFVVGNLELILRSKSPNFGTESSPVSLYVTMDLLHNRTEISEIRRNHRHRVEDLDSADFVPKSFPEFGANSSPNPYVDSWIFMGVFWKYYGEFDPTDSVRIDYEGSFDEEIRGIFWEGETNSVEVAVEYVFDGGKKIHLVDPIPQDILTEIELRTKIIPTMSGARYTPVSERRGNGAVMFSLTADSADCQPGITPRNGILNLKFNHPVGPLKILLLTSRDVIL